MTNSPANDELDAGAVFVHFAQTSGTTRQRQAKSAKGEKRTEMEEFNAFWPDIHPTDGICGLEKRVPGLRNSNSPG